MFRLPPPPLPPPPRLFWCFCTTQADASLCSQLLPFPFCLRRPGIKQERTVPPPSPPSWAETQPSQACSRGSTWVPSSPHDGRIKAPELVPKCAGLEQLPLIPGPGEGVPERKQQALCPPVRWGQRNSRPPAGSFRHPGDGLTITQSLKHVILKNINK